MLLDCGCGKRAKKGTYLGCRPYAAIPSCTPSILLTAAAASRGSPPAPPHGSRWPSRGYVAVHRPLLLRLLLLCTAAQQHGRYIHLFLLIHSLLIIFPDRNWVGPGYQILQFAGSLDPCCLRAASRSIISALPGHGERGEGAGGWINPSLPCWELLAWWLRQPYAAQSSSLGKKKKAPLLFLCFHLVHCPA